MKLSRDIQSLSVFKRDTSKFLKQMKKTGQPIVLTVNGKAAAVIQDVESFDQDFHDWDRRDRIAGVQRGIDDMKAGRTKPASKAFGEFEKKHGIVR